MRVEIGVVGGGFAGSLTAALLSRIGRDVVLLDTSRHPRFRIGESSTPTADLLLRKLAQRFDLPQLEPLSRYGDWRRSYPNLRCGCKRGFSYFQHLPGREYDAGPHHENELLVAASSSDDVADTHWLRADVDLYLFRLAERLALAAWDGVTINEIQQQEQGRWRLDVQRDGEETRFEFDYLIDASGAAGVLGKTLNLRDLGASLRTRTRALYTHAHEVGSWRAMRLAQNDSGVHDHPFDCDLAAQHHLLEEGWVWVLRFDGDLSSVGLVEPIQPANAKAANVDELTAEQRWHEVVGRYPSLRQLCSPLRVADSPGRWVRSGPLQRCWNQASGERWAMLPGAAGFVDPLHSTGIAHSMLGVARLVERIEQHWGKTTFPFVSLDYGRGVLREIDQIDQLVSSCYRGRKNFADFVDMTMLYFVATINFERRCQTAARFDALGDFLGADNAVIRQLIFEANQRLGQPDFREWLYHELQPLQSAGLGDPAAQNMYHHTVAE